MKIVKVKTESAGTTKYTQRFETPTAEQLDELAEKTGMSRNALVEAICKKALADKNFVLEVESKD